MRFADATPEGNLIQVFDSGNNRLFPKTPVPPDFPWPNASGIPSEQFSEVVFAGRRFRVLDTR